MDSVTVKIPHPRKSIGHNARLMGRIPPPTVEINPQTMCATQLHNSQPSVLSITHQISKTNYLPFIGLDPSLSIS